MKTLRKRTIKQEKTFEKKKRKQWYDLIEDWELIDASFTAQYGIRLRNEPDMTWDEFCTLLIGIMPKTPLGQIVSIRSEEDEDMLKNFTKEQHAIRDEWRNKQLKETANSMTEKEQQQQVKEIEAMLVGVFS